MDAIETKAKSRQDLVVDGRTARRNRNKAAVIAAMIDLAREGHDEPAIEMIADRAGVSYRSVYRYFEDRTDLMLSAIGALMRDVWPMLKTATLASGSLKERIASLVEARIAMYHKLAPLTRVAVQRRVHEPAVAEQYERVREQFRQRLTAQFEPELSAMTKKDRNLVVSALDVVFQFEALDFLSAHDGMNDGQMAALLTRHVSVHLAPAVARTPSK